MNMLDQIFNTFFYGSGSWLGLLLFIILILGLVLKWKYSGALMLPISVFLGVEYLNHDGCQWHAIIMFLTSIFILIYMTYKIKER